MNYDIIIFGGGISGLTLAHTLIDKNFSILVVEKDQIYGGMAHTRIEPNNIPSEHSWRGYAPFYKNTFRLLKQIPYDNNKKVYDNLTEKIDFYLLYDKIHNKSKLSIKDNMVLTYLALLYASSDKRKKDYYSEHIMPFLKKYLSKDGYDFIVNFVIGHGYGMNKNEVSMGHLMHFPSIDFISSGHSGNKWYLTNGPTNVVWFDPWVKYLKSKGVKFMNNTSLVKLNYDGNNIIGAVVKNNSGEKILRAKDYIMAVNPYSSVDIFKNSDMQSLYKTFYLLTYKTKSKQISFRIGLNKNVKYPVKNIAFVMNDSEFNITWYPQEQLWKYKFNEDIKSLWSGTIIDFEKNGLLFKKNAESLNNKQLKKEIIYQILRSKDLQKMIYDNNNFYLTINDINYFEIWYEWKFIDGKQEAINKKWVNNIYNEQYRPSQSTSFNNLFLSGGHTRTTINIWSMESAVESGIITANKVLDKYKKQLVVHYKHLDLHFMKNLQTIDNVLYDAQLPNVLNVLLVLIVIMVIIYSIKYYVLNK